MKFIEMTGRTLLRVVSENEISPEQLRECGVKEESLVRVNPQGDIELRRHDRWDVIGGLLGEFDARVRHEQASIGPDGGPNVASWFFVTAKLASTFSCCDQF